MRSGKVAALAVMALALVGVALTGAAPFTVGDNSGVNRANEQFYAALNAMFAGEVEPMENIWSHADDVNYMGPSGGMQVGWDQVLENWQDQAAKKLGGEVRPERMHFNIGRDLAVVACYEVGDNIIAGTPQQVRIRATNTFRKENGQWKMIGHHTDLLPFLAQ